MRNVKEGRERRMTKEGGRERGRSRIQREGVQQQKHQEKEEEEEEQHH